MNDQEREEWERRAYEQWIRFEYEREIQRETLAHYLNELKELLAYETTQRRQRVFNKVTIL